MKLRVLLTKKPEKEVATDYDDRNPECLYDDRSDDTY